MLQTESSFTVEPVAYVSSVRDDLSDDNWGSVVARIELGEAYDAESLTGVGEFSHAEIVFVFHRAPSGEIEQGTRHPRGNREWPRTGIFAQRAKGRPNRIGTTIAEIISVEGRVLTVRGLDAIDGTPVLDIKPVMQEFLPRGEVRQPDWARELMRDYW